MSFRIVMVLFVCALHSAPAAGKLAQDAMRLLHNNCLSCHNAEKHKGGLRLTSRENMLQGGDNGAAAISGKPDKSLIVKVLAPDSDPHMPPKKQLSTSQIQLVRRWIAAGAPWDKMALAQAAAPRAVSLGQLPSSWQPVLAIALSPDDTRLAIARGNQVLIHDVTGTNFNVIAEVVAHSDAVRALAWSADGKSLASGAFREITLWNAELKPQWTCLSNILEAVGAVAFVDDKLIACDGPAAQSGWVRVFAAQTGA